MRGAFAFLYGKHGKVKDGARGRVLASGVSKSPRSTEESMKRATYLLAAVVLTSSTFLPAQELKPSHAKGLATIQWQDVYGYAKKLTSEEFAGRYTGTAGHEAMGAWAASQFKQWGLKPISEKEGYLQRYPVTFTTVDNAAMSVFLPVKTETGKGDAEPADKDAPAKPPELKEEKLKLGEDFLPYISSGTADATAEVVFVGWGVSAPEDGYDDYAGIDVRGKIVLAFSGAPFTDEDKAYEARRRARAVAKEKGAVGFITIAKPTGHPNGERWTEAFPSALLSETVADKILAEKKLNVADLKKDLQTYNRPLSFPLHAKIHIASASQHHTDGLGLNVAGIIPGSDPALKDEVVILGAHSDHMGTIGDILFPGADDNASGTAVVMENAQAFASVKPRPKRSVMFVLFGGEEIDILGARYMAQHLPAPFTKVALVINFDMVGQGDGARASCSTTPPELKQVILDADSRVKIIKGEIRTRDPKRIGGTDHTAFAVLLGCPTAAFFSNGPHPFYHEPADTIYRVNPDIMAQIARLAFLTAAQWADR